MPKRPLPKGDQQSDLFVACFADIPVRDQRDTMERPFFSLAKKPRLAPITYQVGDVRVEVTANPHFGMATIWDADILIWAATQLTEALDRGLEPARTLRFSPYNLLKAIRRPVGGAHYARLRAALDRLTHTAVRANLRADGRKQTASFHWLESWTEVTEEAGGPAGTMTLTCSIPIPTASDRVSFSVSHPRETRKPTGVPCPLGELSASLSPRPSATCMRSVTTSSRSRSRPCASSWNRYSSPGGVRRTSRERERTDAAFLGRRAQMVRLKRHVSKDTMTTIFLSYARGDDEPFVRRLHDDLTAHGFKVWFDRVSMPSRNLTFHQEIRDAVAAHDRLLLVVGPKAVASEYVRQEWQFAWFEAEKVVTPILRWGDYPLAIDELKLVHAEDFRNDADYALHLKELVRILNEPPPRMGKLIAVPSLPAHYLSRTDRLIPLRDAVRSGLDSAASFGGMTARQQFHGIAGAAKQVGMYGMGGIGKSVLANLLAHDRKIREAFPDGIVWVGLGSVPVVADLMRRVHVDFGGDGAFVTEHEGKAKLKELWSDKAVLVVLDDVWRRQDIEAFDILGPRCRALITTRDAGLLTSVGGTQHLVELLTPDRSIGRAR